MFFKSRLSEIANLIDNLILFHFKKGQIIVKEMDQVKGIFFVKSGKIKCVRSNTDRKEVIVKLLSGGDPIGYSIIFGVQNQEFSTICLEDTEVCYLPFHLIKEELKSNTELLKFIALYQNERMRFFVNTIINNTIKTVRERIGYAIFILYEKFGMDANGFIDVVLTREEIANMSATTTESAIRYLSEFQKEKIIEMKNRRIKILDMNKFLKLSGGTN